MKPWGGAVMVRLAIESLVIIASILAAFALDTWWDGVRERRQERDALESLQAEFTVARETIVRYRGNHERILGSVSAIDDSLDRAYRRGVSTIPVTDTSLALAYIPPTTNVSLGTLDGLLASGRLGIIRDRRLRGALASWGAQLAELSEEEEDSRDLVLGDFDRAIRAGTNTHGLWPIAESLFTGEMPADVRRPSRAIRVDRETIGVFQLRSWLLSHSLDEFEPLLAEVDTILALIERSR